MPRSLDLVIFVLTDRDRQTDRRTKPIALPCACGVIISGSSNNGGGLVVRLLCVEQNVTGSNLAAHFNFFPPPYYFLSSRRISVHNGVKKIMGARRTLTTQHCIYCCLDACLHCMVPQLNCVVVSGPFLPGVSLIKKVIKLPIPIQYTCTSDTLVRCI
jgi:hypothetical protein